jgi:hypothetical protein
MPTLLSPFFVDAGGLNAVNGCWLIQVAEIQYWADFTQVDIKMGLRSTAGGIRKNRSADIYTRRGAQRGRVDV